VEAAECEAAERAAHWVAEMDKALAYRRNVDWREASHRAQTLSGAGLCAARKLLSAPRWR
jgi:hypothetical protein